MWGDVTIYLVAGAAAAVVLWYVFFVRYNGRQGDRILEWIHAALAGKGRLVGVRWLGPSIFHVAVGLDTSLFQYPALIVRLIPRENPLRWLQHRWRGDPAHITFEADLDVPPSFNLEVGQHRWSGRSSPDISSDPEGWKFEQVTPLILTSRQDWQREVAAMMNTLLSCRDRNVLRLGFRSTSPHFSATISLECISPQDGGVSNVFDTLREVAAGASASRL
jgi:hypothetical protein